ncbi:MAG: DNA translocase FtsK [Clostridia bacterium]|nr:DNA translocase FtsK [Clostridia bacterium]
MLHKDGIISIFNIASFISDKSRVAGEKIGSAAESMGRHVSDRVKTISEERRRAREELFIEDIYRGEDGEPVQPFDLEKGSKKPRVTGIKAVGDEFVVPDLGKEKAAKSKKRKAQTDDLFEAGYKGKEKSSAQREYDSTYDLLEDIRREDPKSRNERFVKNALKDHSASPKPVLTFDYEKKDSKPLSAESAVKPAAKQPQQPKPSFFDEPVRREDSKTVRQNTEQGKPSDTTYVRPPMARETAQPAQKESVAPTLRYENKLESVLNTGSSAPNVAPAPKAETPKPEVFKPEPPKPERIYYYPPMELMESGGGSGQSSTSSYDDMDRQRAEVLVKTLQNFSIPVKLTGISHGPAVTRFEILPAPGIKVSKVASYADDIAMALAAVSVRIEAPIPGKNAVGVEVPNTSKEVVHLRDILESNEARRNNKRLMVGLGKDNSGKYIVADLASMPHVLIAGQTGSGKSVCINAIIISILYRANPDEVKMILVDPKMVELNVYNTIPHLLVPVVTDPKKAAGALEWAVGEMQRRYKVFSEHGAKNIESYNAHLPEGESKMPQIVIIIDELADLMMTSPRDVEDAINRLAQLARAAGMHLVIATQRPSVDVITGLIKANIPTRIAFTVSSGVDSRTILDAYGAEKLLGKGDMLYLPSDRNKPIRMQGAWVSEEEVQAVVDHVSGGEKVEFDEDMLDHMENAALSAAEKKDKQAEEAASDTDDLFEEALRCVVEAGQASISMLQRKLRVGYARAGRLIDEMAQRGYVSSSEGSKSREVLITREQLNQIFVKDE